MCAQDHSSTRMTLGSSRSTSSSSAISASTSRTLFSRAVWVTYTPKAAKADIEALSAKVKKTPYSLMSPYENQAAPLMLAAAFAQAGAEGLCRLHRAGGVGVDAGRCGGNRCGVAGLRAIADADGAVDGFQVAIGLAGVGGNAAVHLGNILLGQGGRGGQRQGQQQCGTGTGHGVASRVVSYRSDAAACPRV